MSFLSAPALLVAMLKKKKKRRWQCRWLGAVSPVPSHGSNEPSQPAEGMCCSWDFNTAENKTCACFILMIKLSQHCNYLLHLSRRIVLCGIKSRFGLTWQHVKTICQNLLMPLETWSRTKKVSQREEENLKCWANAVVVVVGDWLVCAINCNTGNGLSSTELFSLTQRCSLRDCPKTMSGKHQGKLRTV